MNRTPLPTVLLISISLIGLIPSGALGQPFGAPAQYATGSQPSHVEVGDLNGDGTLDLVTSHANSVSVLLGTGNGAFAAHVDYPTGVTGSLQMGDLNQDGKLDLLILSSSALSVLLGNGDGSFGPRTDFATRKGVFGQPPNLLAVADLNGDSKLDAIVAGWDLLSIFLGNGDGTFGARMDTENMGWEVSSLAIGDMNGDSKPDIAYSKGGEIIVWFGNGDGTFGGRGGAAVSLAHEGGEPCIVAVGDFNGDGKEDLATVVFDVHILAVLLGHGDGYFGEPIQWGSRFDNNTLAKGDFDGDGRLDLAATAEAIPPHIAVLLGAGDGQLGVRVECATGGTPGFIAPADLNDDGRLDLVTNLRGVDSVAVMLNIRNRAPTADAHGPYAGLATQGIDFTGAGSSDPDGDALAYAWDFGDGSTASGPTPRHAYAAEGVFPVILHVTDTGSLSDDDSTSATVRSDVPVAIILKDNGTVLDAKNGKGYTKVAVEQTMMPNASILASTLRLKTDYPTSGTVTECPAEAKAGTGVIGDMDLNTVPDYMISFDESCVRSLFTGAPNNTTANIIVTGEVQTSSGTAPLRGVKSVTVRTRRGSAPISTWASPNPFNPETAISYTVESAGPVTLRIYSIDGRLIRTLKRGEMTTAGTHEVRWEGANDQNQQASSGIYFVRTDQVVAGGAQSAVLKVTLTK
ncbi:MAG: PKD domain-containing protein [Candidatus Eisenbacteria bacterium]|uniref:PKD domain-containing protein n=1 Tax=Eiseniibacteriota bacterium TaxID=2212470 RepID=A0A538TJP4_UNCEI|nr:MAG: PKD domain-containing protein [Candidatus Eisenbacteria bacterium]